MEKEENKQEYIGIKFDLKPPTNYIESTFNTLVLLLRELKETAEMQEWEEVSRFIFNENIERAKKELDNLKIVEFKGEAYE